MLNKRATIENINAFIKDNDDTQVKYPVDKKKLIMRTKEHKTKAYTLVGYRRSEKSVSPMKVSQINM